tara:strand:- start:2261 stop:3184 length:924 start_codon:yes stop_codon:yes gene_type:complete
MIWVVATIYHGLKNHRTPKHSQEHQNTLKMPSQNRGRRTQSREERGMMIVTSRPVRATPAEPLVVIAEAFTDAHENQANHANTIRQLKARIKELDLANRSKDKELKKTEREQDSWRAKAAADCEQAVEKRVCEIADVACVAAMKQLASDFLLPEGFIITNKTCCIISKKTFQEALDLEYIKYHNGQGGTWSFNKLIYDGEDQTLGQIRKQLTTSQEDFKSLREACNEKSDREEKNSLELTTKLTRLKGLYKNLLEDYRKSEADRETLEEYRINFVEGIDKHNAIEAENKQLKEYIAISEGAPTVADY